jgi:putative YphP/YqiW family bacilliredoxin
MEVGCFVGCGAREAGFVFQDGGQYPEQTAPMGFEGMIVLNQYLCEEVPMYPEIMLIPMREELTKAGVKELRTPDEVDRAAAATGTTMIIVNSVCGCAAGRMRPAVRMALQHSAKPDHIYSVFAGQDKEATERARSYFTGYPQSSPSIGILRDGKLVYMMQRSQIETREAPAIAADLATTFDQLCSTTRA